MCVCVLLVTWRANGIVLYMYEGKVLMDRYFFEIFVKNMKYTVNNYVLYII